MSIQFDIDPSYRRTVITIAARLSAVPSKLRPAVRKNLRNAGELVADRARRNASSITKSTRIPRAIKVKVAFRQGREGVNVIAESRIAPHAYVYELGSKRNGSTYFRHPVFARGPRYAWTWRAERTRPYMKPAVAESGPDIVKALEQATSDAFRDAGL